MTTSQPDPTERARRVWSAGSYPNVGIHLLGQIAHLVTVAGVHEGDEVLDVGCGTGNVALTARRRGARVTGLDLTPKMLEGARENAAVGGVTDVEWREGDVADLPFADDRFDVVLSNVGHVFAPDAEAAGRELARVAKPGGRVAFTSWTPEGELSDFMTVFSEYVSPPPGAPSPPATWGDPEVVRERLGDAVEDVTFERGTVTFPGVSPMHFVADMLEHSGPTIAAFEQVPEGERDAVRAALVEIVENSFEANAVESEYLLTRATVR